VKVVSAGGPSSLVFLSQVARAGAQWVLVWLFARTGGPAAVSQIAVGFAITAPVFILAELGLRNVYLTMRDRPGLGHFMRLRIIAVALATIATNLVPLVTDAVDSQVMLPLSLLKFIDSILDMALAVPQSQGRIATYASAGIANALGSIALAVAATFVTSSVTSALWASLVGSSLTLVLLMAALPRWIRTDETIGTSARSLFRTSWPLGVATGVNSALGYLPVLFLAWWGTASDTGIYAAAAYALTFGNLALASAQQALLPQNAKQVRDQGREVSQVLHSTLRTFSAVSFCLAVPCLALLPLVMPMVYGPGFVISHLEVLPFALSLLCLAAIYSTGTALMLMNAYRRQLTTALVAFGFAVAVAGALSDSASVLAAGLVALAGYLGRGALGLAACRTELAREARRGHAAATESHDA
jgi:O-antigen/teichoic acid export membrane protein